MRRQRYRTRRSTVGAVTQHDVPPARLPRDARWPRAGEWLAAGPGPGAPDLAVLGVPTFATSLSPTGAHQTPAAGRRALARFSAGGASRRGEGSGTPPPGTWGAAHPPPPVPGWVGVGP